MLRQLSFAFEDALTNRLGKHPNTCSAMLAAKQAAAAAAAVDAERLALPPLNYEMLEQNLGREASMDILRVYLSATAELIVELQSAVRVQSYKEAAAALRELHSSCTVVGANGVLQQCLSMEESLRKADWVRLEQQMVELVKETRQVGQFINQLLSQAIRVHFSR